MKNNDTKSREEIRQAMQAALAGNDAQGFSDAMNDMLSCIGEEIRQEYGLSA